MSNNSTAQFLPIFGKYSYLGGVLFRPGMSNTHTCGYWIVYLWRVDTNINEQLIENKKLIKMNYTIFLLCDNYVSERYTS